MPSLVRAYEINTHSYLTSEAIELYNKNTEENKISSELKRFLIDGSIHEDDDPRYRNHFYDPINDEGLDDKGTRGQSAKEWVNDQENQSKLGYALLSDSSLSPVDRKKIEGLNGVSNFTWDAALRYWIQDEEEMAMEVLGHVLHLMEDMGVPEHTRNDGHPYGSDYEEFSSRYDANTPDEELRERLGDKKPVSLRSLDKYFDGLAKYSNKYFYSPESIGEYDFPELDYKTAEARDDGRYYFKSKDDEGLSYYLISQRDLNDIYATNAANVSVVKPLIMESYWNLLSVRTVRYSAGVIDLFFRDVERVKNDPDFLKQPEPDSSIAQKASSFFGSLWNGTKGIAVKTGTFFGNMFSAIGDGISSATGFVGGLFTNDNGLTDAGSVRLESDAINTVDSGDVSEPAIPKAATAKKDTTAKKSDEIAALKAQIAQLQKEAQIQDKAVLALEKKEVTTEDVVREPEQEVKSAAVKVDGPLCTYASTNRATTKPIVINEVAWMGGVRSAGDEWIELKNISTYEVDISGWQLLNKGGGIKVQLNDLKDTTIEPGQFVLLERTDNNAAVGASADLIYSGALGNANDGLKLFDGSCGVVDEIVSAAHWAAGSNDSKQTMERRSQGGWQTSVSSGGTPKKENSHGVTYSTGGGAVVASSQSTQNGMGGNPASTEPQFYPVVINEIMYDVDGSDVDREWIELYNSGNASAAIGDWKLFKNDTAHGLVLAQGAATISAGGYAVITQSKNAFLQDNSGFDGTIFESAFSLHNDGESLAIKNSTLTIDATAYASSTGANGNGLSLQLFEGQWVAASSTPGRANVKPMVSAVEQDNATSTATTSQLVHDSVSSGLSVITYFQSLATSTSYTIGSFTVRGSGIAGNWKGGVCEFDSATVRCLNSLAHAYTNMPGGDMNTPINFTFATPVLLDAGTHYALYVEPTGSVHIKDRVSRVYGSTTDSYSGGKVFAFGQYEPYHISEPIDIGLADMYFAIEQGVATAATTSSSTDTVVATSTATTTEPQFYPVTINEVMYDLSDVDEGREWIELYNSGTTTADISEWKFRENDTHHGLVVKQGSSVLPAGGYAIVANNSDMFLADNVGYAGTLIDSTFSLSNEGEALSVKNGDLVIDTIVYASSMGANGDGHSLQKSSDGWKGSLPTPGAENVFVVTESTTTTTLTTDGGSATMTAVTGDALKQLSDSAVSASGPTSAFYQTLEQGTSATVAGFRVAVGGVTGRWQGSICEFDTMLKKCVPSTGSSRVNADVSVVDGSAKTPASFTFAASVVLDPSKLYALAVFPTGDVRLDSRIASVYGSMDDVYPGMLYVSRDGTVSEGASIADMYFEIQ